MKLCFDSIAEVKDFIASLKGTRGKKGEGDDLDPTLGPQTHQAPTPIMPPAQQSGAVNGMPAAFNPPPAAVAFPGPAAAPTAAPVVDPIVGRIVSRIDSAIAGGQHADTVLSWFRGQCGNEAANATLDQIKQVFLPKLPMPALENIAKLMNA